MYPGDRIKVGVSERKGLAFNGVDYDTRYFTKIEEVSAATGECYYILEAKDIGPEQTAILYYTVVLENKNKLSMEPKYFRSTKDIVIYGNPYIELTGKEYNIKCLGEKTEYWIRNLTLHPEDTKNNYSNTKIEWLEWSNISPISVGNDIPDASFQALNNGFINIKAMVKFRNKTFYIENSDVWVGVPPAPTRIKGIPPAGIQTNSVYGLTITNSYANSVENYYWKPLAGEGKPGYPRLVPDNIGATLFTGSSSNLLNIMLAVRAENKCGISAFYILPVTSSGSGGPSPFSMIKSNSSVNENTYDIKIYSFTTGQTVYQEKNTIDFKIENTTLKSGIYIIELTDENSNVTRTKVMKK